MNELKAKRGFSIIGSLLGFSLLGLSTMGLAVYMGSFEQVKVEYSRQSNINFMHNELLGGMGKIITMTSTKVGGPLQSLKKFGLCSVILKDTAKYSYEKVKDKAICPIHVKGQWIYDGTSYTRDARWKHFVELGGTWELLSTTTDCDNGENGFKGSFTANSFNKCFKYVGEGQDSTYARLSMEPQQLPAFKKVKTADTVPIDELVFRLRSIISTRRNLDAGEIAYSLSKGEKYLWSTEALDCQICKTGDTECKLTRFSTSAKGTASRHSKICYHSAYETKLPAASLEIKVEKIPPRFEKNNNQLRAKTAQDDYSASCRSNLFRCGSSQKEDFDPALRFQFLLNYDQAQDSHINKMELSVKKSGSEKKHGTFFVPADQQARVGRNESGADTTFADKEWPLRAGGNDITAFMADRKGTGSLCQSICSETSANFYPQLKVGYGGLVAGVPEHSETQAFNNRKIACFQCNMKGCHRMGVGTHTAASHASRDDEPQDGIVPECAVEDNISTTPDTTTLSGASTLSNRCLKKTGTNLQAAACTNTTGGSSHEFKTGTTESACFSEGKTKVLKGGYTGGLDARKNCRQNLHEEQLIGEVDHDGIWREGVLPSIAAAYNLPPKGSSSLKGVKEILEESTFGELSKTDSGDYYSFDNWARFSAFLGDHTQLTNPSNVFVPFQRDASGMFHSGWTRYSGVTDPKTGTERERWAFFYREPFNTISFHDAKTISTLPTGVSKEQFLGRVRPSRPVYIKMDANFHADYSPDEHPVGSNKQDNAGHPVDVYPALTHHLAYKGIRPVKSTSTNAYPYLCRNIKAGTYKEAFVTTTITGTNINHGYEKCSELGDDWHFIPPDSRELWAAALQAVAPNAPRYPFPNPFNFADGIPFWTELKSGDTGYDSKKRQWKLSYDYEDMGEIDYKASLNSDNQFLFNRTTKFLAAPATAWIGGFKSGGNAGSSWTWKPNWKNLLNPCSAPPCSLPADALEPANRTSLLYGGESESSITSVLSGLDNDNDLVSNIGVLSPTGRELSVRSLRESNALTKFKTHTMRLCRYSKDESALDFHLALIITGKGSSWPSGVSCGDLSASGSSSALKDEVDSFYFEIPSTPGNTNLEDLAAKDFVEVSQGIRTILPLLSYNKYGGMHVQNQDKFCRAWKREKKRRAVGNCIVDGYNTDVLSKGGVNHGVGITRTKRASSDCHGSGVNCATAVTHYTTQYNALVAAKEAARLAEEAAQLARDTAKTNRDNASSSISADRSKCRERPGNCMSLRVGRSVSQWCYSTCMQNPPSCTTTTTTNEDGETETERNCDALDARRRFCRRSAPSACSRTVYYCEAACSACQTRNAEISAACSRVSAYDGFESERVRQEQIRVQQKALKERYLREIACADPKLPTVTTNHCMSNLASVETHTTSYTPAIVSCSSFFTPLSIDFNGASDSRCWSLEKLNPQHTVTGFNDGVSSLTGTIGILGDTGLVTNWDKSAACNTGQSTSSLYSLPAECGGQYRNIVDLDNNLCNDDGINYSSHTCAIP